MSGNGDDQTTDTPGSGDRPQEGTGVQPNGEPELRPEAAPPAPDTEPPSDDAG
ncbi:MAG TPA: hypothetical protein VET24_00580 [Actinomycetota bacterium]|nr:hypothetical protein [Actinomycetota bacterium]